MKVVLWLTWLFLIHSCPKLQLIEHFRKGEAGHHPYKLPHLRGRQGAYEGKGALRRERKPGINGCFFSVQMRNDLCSPPSMYGFSSFFKISVEASIFKSCLLTNSSDFYVKNLRVIFKLWTSHLLFHY